FGRYEPILGISLQQPLMKNAFGMNDRGAVNEAKRAYAAADQAVRREVDKLVYEALQDYWALFFIREHMKSIERAISFAREFLGTTLEERKLGTAEETDVLAARANLLGRQNELSAYRELEEVAEEALRNDLELDPHEELSLGRDYPPRIKKTEPVEEMISRAMSSRGDYLAALEEIERQRIRVKMAKNSRWPQLDLVSTLDLNEIDRSYGDALSDMDSPNFTAGLSLSVPIENRAARAGARRAEAERARAVYEAKDLEKRIANEIARLAVAIGERLTIVEQTQKALAMHLEKQRLELGKYRLGRSSSDTVKRYQDDTVDTQRNLFEAWLAYKKAMLDLRLALGDMVAERGGIVESTEVGR
ncbi:MAG: TolC family protein, partial [Proteobacteria bacterium]|nr:TolC family protein [Pseudomonadota bacterium]